MLLVLFGLAAGGVLAILMSGMGSRPRPSIGLFLPGLMVLTLAVIFGVGAFYGWRGFEKRFCQNCLLGHWQIPDRQWLEYLKREKKRLRRGGLLTIVGMPVVVSAVILGLAYEDGEFEEALPIALLVSAFMVLVFSSILAIQWFAVNGNSGRVWLSERGVMVNRTVFFIDGYGMKTLSREIREDDGKPVLSIRYQVRSRHTVVDKELLVPVPEDQEELVAETVERWNSENPPERMGARFD